MVWVPSDWNIAVNLSWCLFLWKADFSTSTLLTHQTRQFCAVCGCPMPHRIFSVIPGLYPLDTSSSPPIETIKVSPKVARCPWEQNPSLLIENHWYKTSHNQMSAHLYVLLWLYGQGRLFHMHFLFAAAININILLCNSGNSLAGKMNGRRKAKISSCDMAVHWITCYLGANKGGDDKRNNLQLNGVFPEDAYFLFFLASLTVAYPSGSVNCMFLFILHLYHPVLTP